MISPTTAKDLQNAYHTWNAKKGSTAQPFFDLVAEDVNFGSITDGAPGMDFTRKHSGKGQLKAYFEELAQDWEMIFFHVRNFLVQDDRVAVVCECCWRHRRTGKIVHSPKLDIWRFRDNRATDVFEFFDSEQAIAACSGNVDPRLTAAPAPLYPDTPGAIIEGVTESGQANVQQLKNLYKEWHETKGKSAATIMNLLGPQIVWGSLADGADGVPFTVEKRTRDEVAGYFEGLSEMFAMDCYRAGEFLAAGDFVLMIGSCAFTNKITGRGFDMPKADLWRFSDGKAVEFFEYYDTAAVLATTRQPTASVSNAAASG